MPEIDDSQKKTCPLLMMAQAQQVKTPLGIQQAAACVTFACNRERCMWWSETEEDCRVNLALEAITERRVTLT